MDDDNKRLKRNAYMREWKRRNKDKANKYNRRWKENNRERSREINLKSLKKMRKLKPKLFAEYRKRHREKHSDKIRISYKKWYENGGHVLVRQNKMKRLVSEPFHYLFSHAKARAKKRGIEFNLARDDIIIPDVCPVLGLKIEKGKHGFSSGSPSIDRINLSKGYVRGNVRVISWRANKLKSDATVEEMEKVLDYMKSAGEGW